MDNKILNTISWKIIDKYFEENKLALVNHHIQSYNDFMNNGIKQILHETNPIKIHKNYDTKIDDFRYKLDIYIGGKEGNKLYYGQPVIYEKNNHYMYPNEARLKNMTYATTIHYDIDIVCTITDKDTQEVNTIEKTYNKIFLGKIPILLHSDLCILSKVSKSIAFQMGECKNDIGGYFIIDGKEKCFIPQEKFADNVLYIKKNASDDIYSHSAIIRTVSEDVSKPERTFKIHIVGGENDDSKYMEKGQIVVEVPNVRKPIPLFILMRALGIISDKQIIETCLLNLEENKNYVDLFIPSIHDASILFTQETALQFIKTFTKQETITQVYEILINYLLPNIGEDNFLNKALCIGDIVFRLLKVYKGISPEIDRDNFKYKRVELLGPMMHELFKEYYKQQQRDIYLRIEQDEIYYHYTQDESEEVTLNLEKTLQLFDDNIITFFKDRSVEEGFKKGFKGNWGSKAHTKREGIIQDLNRLSFNSARSLLRKLNLPIDSSAKVVGPRLLHGSQWGYIDPIDTPDGGNVGTHKHLAIMTKISMNYSGEKFKLWLKENTKLFLIENATLEFLYNNIKIFINGVWFAVTDEPINFVDVVKYYRRINQISNEISITFDIEDKSIYIYTDSGRLLRPIYYIADKKLSIQEPKIIERLIKDELTWNEIIHGTFIDDVKFPSLIDYIDSSECNDSLICLNSDNLKGKNNYSHLEIEPSLILGILGNQVIFPQHNPPTRNLFSCGQTKQAVSMYHSNFQNRFDKMGVILNYGQLPLIKSKYLKYINNYEHPYGENTIVAIMSLNGYNVEDAILVNEGSVKRGLFRTTYYTTYETSEESTDVVGSKTQSSIKNVNEELTVKLKPGYDYNDLDNLGLIKENTPINDKKILIGKSSQNIDSLSLHLDNSIGTKKGQLGFVDKTFLSDNQEGFRVAKVRIREERIPNIGDKMASRAGQKGTIGLIIPEYDMPFTESGIKPDLIINPHAIPSRMTIGQLIEMLLGKVCLDKGCFSDCTAFMNKGGQEKLYGNILTNIGYHSSGNEIMYDGITGQQLTGSIFMGPTYYMRLKHMVKDKINFRATGPRNVLTRQTVQGRANDGGLRIGEMERDGVIAHGMSSFLKDSFMVRGDPYYVAICNNTGSIAIYNVTQNKFYSPLLDGPVKLSEPLNNKSELLNVSKFGMSFSIIKIPYCLKLLIQELQTMNIGIKLITEDNINQLCNMNYSIDINSYEEGKTNMEKHDRYMKNDREIYDKRMQDADNARLLKEKEQYVYETPEKPKYTYNKGERVVYIKDIKPEREWYISAILDDENIAIKSNDLENIDQFNEILKQTENSVIIPVSIDEIKPILLTYKDDDSISYTNESPGWAPGTVENSPQEPVIPGTDSPPYAPDSNNTKEPSKEFSAVINEQIQDISEYKQEEDEDTDKNDESTNEITIKTDQIGDIIESSKFDSILQPKKLQEDSKEAIDGNEEHSNEGKQITI